MTGRRKARVGDTIRHNGKNPAYKAGEEFVVTRVVDETFSKNGDTSTYWVSYDDTRYYMASAWEHQFDIVEPEPEFNRGDRVKLTPKDGGETVIYGEVGYNDSRVISVQTSNDREGRIYDRANWNIEPVKPTTKEILSGLGENAYVAHRTDAGYYGYYKRGGKWYDADDERSYSVGPHAVAMWIDDEGFEIIFEGIKGE